VIFLNLDELLYVAVRTLHEKATALLHSVARDHALVDGNKRLALGAAIAFYGINGMRLTLRNDEAYGLVIDIASGRLDDVPTIADVLEAGTEER
jgi:death on curing protein